MKDKTSMRLIWKEYREGWPVILAFFVLPGIVFPVCRFFPNSDVASGIVLAVLFAVPFTAVLWASEKRRMVKQNKDILEAVLPVSPIQEWLFTFMIPALVVGLCGGWMNMLFTTTHIAGESHNGILVSMLVTALAYMLSSYLSKSVSSVLGIMAGTLWVIFTLFPVVDASLTQYAIAFAGIAIGSLLASEFRKAGLRQKKASAWIVLVLFIVVISARSMEGLGHDLLDMTSSNTRYINGIYDEKTRVEVWRYPGKSGVDRIECQDGLYRSWSSDKFRRKTLEIKMPSVSVPVAMDESFKVYIFTQKPGSYDIAINRWDTRTGRIDQVCKLENEKGFNNYSITKYTKESNWISQIGWVNPAGTKLLINIPSALGTGYGRDLRLIDLTTGANNLLLVDERFAWDKSTWTKDCVYLTGIGNSIEVNTDTFEAKPLIEERNNTK